MKILYTITKSEIGGAQVHVALLAKHMKDLGHTVSVVSSPGGWLEYETTNIGVRFYENKYFGNSFNPFRILKSFFLIQKIVREFQPDIIHCHSSFAGIITRLAVRKRVTTVFTAHSWAFTDGASLFRKIIGVVSERFFSRWVDAIICVSQYDRQLALRYKVAPQHKLKTIYNGAEKNLFTNSVKEDILITNGRLAYPKEYLLLLEAYKKSGINLHLQIISDGPLRKIIEEKIQGLGIQDRVTLLGNLSSREAVQEKLSKAKLFILLSKHEGFPLAILEAMSAGLPVIASSVGGIPEQIDTSCGFLVSNTKEEIADALRKMSNNNSLMAELGDNARRKFEQNFTLEKFSRVTESLYHVLMGKDNLNSLEKNSNI